MSVTLDNLPLFLTPDKVAELTDSDRKTVYKAIQAGQIPATKLGRKVLISRLVIERMLAGE